MTQQPDKIICIIDDDADVRNSVRALLESYEFAVIDYPSPADFLAAVAPGTIGCFLLDLQMPGMTGIEFLEHLRSKGDKTPAIVVTANGHKLANRFERANALAVLRKPIGDEELLHWIERALAAD